MAIVKYFDSVLSTNATGKTQPVASASVYVYEQGTNTLATIYEDDGTTTKTNPLTTDSNGNYEFRVEDGAYDIRITFSGTDKTFSYVALGTTIADDSITTAKIADNAVTNAKMADDAIDTSELADGAVTTAKIENLAVTAGKISSGAATDGQVLTADGAGNVTFEDGGSSGNASETEAGVVEIATDAEAFAGTSTGSTGAILALTPTNFTATQSLSSNGYQRLAGGLIIQWGSATPSSAFTVTFPTTFPTACASFVMLDQNDGDTAGQGTTAIMAGSPSTSSVACSGTTASNLVRWVAIGY